MKTGIKTKGMSGKPIVTEAPYGYVKDPDNKDFWIIDEEAAEVVRLIFRLFIGGKNRNQIIFTTLITDYITLVTVFISGYVTSSPDTCLSRPQKDFPV